MREFSRALLASIDRLSRTGSATAQAVLLDMERVLGRSIAQAQLYTTLPKLTNAGLVHSVDLPPEPRQGGRRRRAFSLTDAGLALLEDARSALMR
jgi:DNA-binding PadR family transcriptional regulator